MVLPFLLDEDGIEEELLGVLRYLYIMGLAVEFTVFSGDSSTCFVVILLDVRSNEYI